MKTLIGAAGARQADAWTIQNLGIPGIALMESAARQCAERIRARFPEAAGGRTAVLCGGGNNGGDGYAIARWLLGFGWQVVLLSARERSRGDAALNREAAQRLGIPTVDSLDGAALIVDALYGTGVTRALAGEDLRWIEAVARARAGGARVVSIDVPSGLNADSGERMGAAVGADLTLTLGWNKVGFFLRDGPKCAGEVEVLDIGLGHAQVEAVARMAEARDLRWPRRSPLAHKGHSGHLLVIAGSRRYSGAAVLCCSGALAAGAGLVTLAAPRGARLEGLAPEVMVVDSGAGDFAETLSQSGPWTAIAAGPGLGEGALALQAGLEELWRTFPGGAVFDADALVAARGATGGARVVTPHPGEAARWLGTSAQEVETKRLESAQELAIQCGGVALLKGPRPLIAEAGQAPWVVDRGTAALATGGAGDVLTGVIGALLAQGLSALDAALAGAWVHAEAGARLSARRSQGWVARDIAAEVPEVIEAILSHP